MKVWVLINVCDYGVYEICSFFFIFEVDNFECKEMGEFIFKV